jgi:hypothetical protein
VSRAPKSYPWVAVLLAVLGFFALPIFFGLGEALVSCGYAPPPGFHPSH